MRLLLLLTGCSLFGQPVTLNTDPAQTTVEYKLGATLHTVHGTFPFQRGKLTIDLATGKVSGELVIDAKGGSSGSEGRDRRMHESILETSKYPEIVFRPDRMDGKLSTNGHSDVQLHGTMAIHGGEHEISVPVGVDAANGVYRARAVFVVPYIQWGIKNPSTLVLRVSDKVEITVNTVAR